MNYKYYILKSSFFQSKFMGRRRKLEMSGFSKLEMSGF